MCLKSQHSQIEIMCILAYRLEWKWFQDKPIRIVFTCFVCMLMMRVGALERVYIFILAEGLNPFIVFFFFVLEL